MKNKKGNKKQPKESVKALKTEISEKLMELTEVNRKLRRKIYDLYTIFELSRNFNAVLSYQTLLDSFVLTSMGQMGAAKAALYLPLEVGKRRFQLARAKGAPPFPPKEISINPEGNFGDYITALNRPIQVNEIRRKFTTTDDSSFTDYFPAGLVVPLIFQTKLRGILIISAKVSNRQYQDDDIEFLSVLANQTAVSIENARLYESETEAINKLQKTQELLLQSEKLAALGDLSAKIAHEVNNPLGIIKNYLLLVERSISQNDKASEYIGVIGREIDRIAVIVRQLLDFHRPRAIKFIRTDIIKIIGEVISLMNRQMEENKIRLSLTANQVLPVIMAWPDGLKQVFINLLINAKEAMKDGGEIEIIVTSLDHVIKIRFKDTGPGINEKHIPHIFEPFFTTKENRSSMGLGLSVCSGIIRNHGGSIEYYNTDTGGCFEIKLPIEQKEENYDWRI
ncbi:MAG: ATP-binding protein [candidate division Zixibacteria bacterium]|nr:ATP-binding protein [candidate division Zixibacteria bacterium]